MTEVKATLNQYRRAYEKYVKSWEEGPEGTYLEDWTDYLSDTVGEEYDSEGTGGRHFEFMAEIETVARIQRAALLSKEHARFMAWLVEKGKQELYEEFEKVLRVEHTKGEYPGVPVMDLNE